MAVIHQHNATADEEEQLYGQKEFLFFIIIIKENLSFFPISKISRF